MNRKRVYLLLAVIAMAALVTLVGCKKKEEPVAAMEDMTKQATTAAEDMKKTATATADEAKKAAETMAASMEQTTCPVEGAKIDKNVFVEYKGKKVYFCCSACKDAFEADPEKYIAKLPQFKQ